MSASLPKLIHSVQRFDVHTGDMIAEAKVYYTRGQTLPFTIALSWTEGASVPVRTLGTAAAFASALIEEHCSR